MSTIFGTAVITVDGYELPSIEGTGKFQLGLPTGKIHKGPRGYIGASVMPNTSKLTCDVAARNDFDIQARLSAGKEVTVRFADDYSEQAWVVPQMVMTEDPELTDGDSAKWTLTLEGASAEKA
ncbi:phage tail tube protein [Thalassospira sp. MCCC 1A01428]|uniref:phage tail tube protein n=1 Tax=Thalassospira sp. MCCC 1A01428 TaxID=1470575 RepID=UPI000A1EA03D|nr:phage tail tube protein [Thalassospira sp. MCCC 1A01428]OSQ41670.1 hypothetical protein THS27_18345 [Thalassospira sp. MCCC 1A01428]